MWDTLGGVGCYEELLAIAREVGQETKSTILTQKVFNEVPMPNPLYFL